MLVLEIAAGVARLSQVEEGERLGGVDTGLRRLDVVARPGVEVDDHGARHAVAPVRQPAAETERRGLGLGVLRTSVEPLEPALDVRRELDPLAPEEVADPAADDLGEVLDLERRVGYGAGVHRQLLASEAVAGERDLRFHDCLPFSCCGDVCRSTQPKTRSRRRRFLNKCHRWQTRIFIRLPRHAPLSAV